MYSFRLLLCSVCSITFVFICFTTIYIMLRLQYRVRNLHNFALFFLLSLQFPIPIQTINIAVPIQTLLLLLPVLSFFLPTTELVYLSLALFLISQLDSLTIKLDSIIGWILEA